jgi:hypothetical protein
MAATAISTRYKIENGLAGPPYKKRKRERIVISNSRAVLNNFRVSEFFRVARCKTALLPSTARKISIKSSVREIEIRVAKYEEIAISGIEIIIVHRNQIICDIGSKSFSKFLSIDFVCIN